MAVTKKMKDLLRFQWMNQMMIRHTGTGIGYGYFTVNIPAVTTQPAVSGGPRAGW